MSKNRKDKNSSKAESIAVSFYWELKKQTEETFESFLTGLTIQSIGEGGGNMGGKSRGNL